MKNINIKRKTYGKKYKIKTMKKMFEKIQQQYRKNKNQTKRSSYNFKNINYDGKKGKK
jgi:hypothetical protein